MSKTEVPFADVLPGEGFVSAKTKRCFIGLKIKDFFDISTIEFSGRLNAVILSDCMGLPAHDVGTLIYMQPDVLVEVDRSPDEDEGMELVIKFPPEKKKRLYQLMEESLCRTGEEWLNNAITLCAWAQECVSKGEVIASVDESKKIYREILLPLLENVATLRRLRIRARLGDDSSVENNKLPLSWFEENSTEIRYNTNGSVTYTFDDPDGGTSKTTVSKEDYDQALKDPSHLI
jgi:hypothetical protein